MVDRRSGVLAAAILAVGCTSTVTPSGSGSSEQLVVAVGEAYVMTLLDDERPFFDVRVDVVGPTGVSRPIASFRDVRPAGWEASMPFYDMVAVVGPTQLLPVVADGGSGGDTFRTLLLDLGPGGGPTVEVAGSGRPFWGPGGLLAVDGQELEVVDPRTGAKTAVRSPDGIETSPYWLADGSGWAATRLPEDGSVTPGSLSIAGAFTAGRAPLFQGTGRERVIGAMGGQLSFSVSDGPNSSESAIAEYRGDISGPCQCVIWAARIEPSDDPAFGEASWDATGTGIWLVFRTKDRSWLSHIVEPKLDAPVVDLPPEPSWFIVGLSTDDRWIVLSAPESGSLVMVDTVAGTAQEIARARGEGAMLAFAGWVR